MANRKLIQRQKNEGRKDCSHDSHYEKRILEGGLWSLVSILFVPSRKIGKGAAGGHKASVGLKLRCLLLQQPQSHAWCRAMWWEKKMERLYFGKLARVFENSHICYVQKLLQLNIFTWLLKCHMTVNISLVYICLCVCICIHVYMCLGTCMYISVYMYVYI